VITPGVHEALRAAGIALTGEDRLDVQRASARAARLVRERRLQAVGFAPASDDVAVAAVALEVGRALALTSTGPVGVVDASGTWPCARALVDCGQDAGALSAAWVLEHLAVLTPRTLDAGRTLARLRGDVEDARARFEHLLVDLTGFHRPGERAAALEQLDAGVLVARSGVTKTRHAQRAFRDVPEGRSLGVLLTGI
jgi:hypothetical protein